ncbi:amino acid adenylation domain-containing protein [Methylorubrum sp. SB2]|uniref:amino acid adenylation domain-containing protein n=1 Tax=Methylorubrum subtropicum TaxID=3138812 RepID=UPI00313E99D2
MSALTDRLRTLAARLAAAPPEERAALLARFEAAGIGFDDLPVPPTDPHKPAPASDAQRRLYFLWRLDPSSAAYAVGGAVRLTGPLDRAALKGALDGLVARHDALRTRFLEVEDGSVLQIADPAAPCALAEHECEGSDAETALRALVRATVERPFDLAAGPLLRVGLARLGPDRHALILALHHAICDAWSLGVLTREIGADYAARLAGNREDIPTPPLRFSDWAAWQAIRQETGRDAEALARVRVRLADAPRGLAFPERLPAAPREGGRARRVPLTFPASTQAALHRLASERGVTPVAVTLAAFAVFLGRGTGRDDLCLGMPAANREGAATHGVVGPFVNTLPLRLRPAPAQPFAEIIETVAITLRRGMAEQALPFDRIAEGLGEAGRNPLDALFAYERAPAPPRFPGLVAEPIPAPPETPKFDLVLGVEEGEGGALEGALILAEARFLPGTAERWAARFLGLLGALLAGPDAPCGEAPLLTDEERALLAAQHRMPPAPPFVPVSARVAAVEGHRIALVHGERRLTYAELNARANALAHALIRRGVSCESRVALRVTRSPDAFVAILAVLKAGAAYVPVDPEAPLERRDTVIRQADARLLLTDAPGEPPAACPTLRLEDPDAFAGPASEPAVAIHPDQLAYVIFTSGSTGQPKGVAVTHGPLAMHAEAVGARYALTRDDRVLHLIALSFDGATEAWLAALFHGGCLVIGEPRGWTAEDTLEAIRAEGVTVTGMSPALLSSLAEAHARAGGGPLPMRSWTAGGEAFGIEAFQTVRNTFAPARIINGYGPTETVITPLLLTIDPDTPASAWDGADWLPIGTPVGARTAYVLDERLHEVGVGVPGELFIGGEGLARGYVGAPAETAARFVPDPFGAPGGRLYRTGDRVVRRADGSLTYLGRLDAQVKVRGFRIEPGEVEAHLLAHPRCREAAVTATRRGEEAHLVAYVAGRGGEGADSDLAEVLAAHLAERLPAHMRPSLIVVLPALPRLASGKLDRTGLPTPEWKAGAYEPPQGATEEALARLWSALLAVERVGRAQTFFALGGHSLLAAKLVARIRAELGRDLPLRAVFEAPSLAALAARIEAAPPVAKGSGVPRAAHKQKIPATDMQAALWQWQRRHPGSAAWTIFGAIRLSGPLDTDALRASFDHVAARHEALRTTFREGEAGLELLVHPPAPVRIERLDLTDRLRREAEAQALAFAQGEADRPFDMAADRPLRVGLARIGRQDHVLTLAVHHAAGDGRAMALLLDELGAAYRAFATGSEPGLPEPTRQATDYAAWRRAQDRSAAAETRLAQALERLSGPWQPDPVPTDRPRTPALGSHGARLRFELPAATVSRLADRARAVNATLPMATLAALSVALRRRSDRNALSLGLLVSDRGPAELDAVVGCLVATELTVLDVDPQKPFDQLLASVRDERLAAQDSGPVPYARLLDALREHGLLDREGGPFQVMFSYLRAEPETPDWLAGLKASDLPVECADESYELEFDLKERPDGSLAVSVGYLTGLFDAATVAALAEDFAAVVASAARDPGRPVARLWPPPALPGAAA